MATNLLTKQVGSSIKHLRLAKGIGQTEVALALGISVAALSKIEAGLTDINLSRLAQIAKYFQVSIISILSKDIVSEVSENTIDEFVELKNKLADKEKEVVKLQKKVIDLYEKLGL
ncbi:helix-turn-helix domain-containing protein [Pedobacter sp. ASV28]|uniref:helix-turn-helix domain-containing protein n=1 Tax=Pedobacter sp. ASV28 TaxID=2795123 RepID=UPI0018EC2739|nr:helix-turn-helix transcriptional regulator [Pedobacter sp. ASV28]